MKQQRKKRFQLRALFILVLAHLMFVNGSAGAEPWRFGVMSDTQWTAPTDPAGKNPNGVAVSIIEQINQKFIEAGVRFVIQVGDLTEDGYDTDIAKRAEAAQMLYRAGTGFFPMRGNHETYANCTELNRNCADRYNHNTNKNSFGIPAVQANFPQTRGLSNTLGATNFSSPTSVSTDLQGMSYSFDYGTEGNNARFVIVDNWATPGKVFIASGLEHYYYGYSINDQQSWISSRLDKKTRGTTHAFVFSHQNLIGENHQDSLFHGYPNENPEWQNAFLASLQDNGVKYFISGHDHIHQRSIITSPDGASKVEQLICASNSSKFYTPKPAADPKWFGQKAREASISQELYTIGYYIFTIEGPRVTVDYYSDDHGKWQSDASYPNGPKLPDTGITPTLNFVKKETWSYTLSSN